MVLIRKLCKLNETKRNIQILFFLAYINIRRKPLPIKELKLIIIKYYIKTKHVGDSYVYLNCDGRIAVNNVYTN